MAGKARLLRELEMMKRNPPWGISCDFAGSESLNRVEAKLVGPKDSPYSDGVFTIQIDIPVKYPFEPPQVKFITPIYHPNIDKGGRICMDLIKMPPKGEWRPTVSLEWVLVTLQLLLANPNPDDPLMIDIANQYKCDREAYNIAAADYTLKYATR